MSQNPHRTLWRRDFRSVPAAERRLALQWLDSVPAARVALSADNTLGSMWRLTLPLLDPDAVAGWLPPIDDGSPDKDAGIRYASDLERQLANHINGDWPDDEHQALDRRRRHRVHGFFKTLPRAVLTGEHPRRSPLRDSDCGLPDSLLRRHSRRAFFGAQYLQGRRHPLPVAPRLLSRLRIDASVAGDAVRVETAITEPSPPQIRT